MTTKVQGKRLILGVLAVFAIVAVSSVNAQESVSPFEYRKEKKHFRFILQDGQQYETWNVIIVNIPGRVKLNSQEFNQRMVATVSQIRTEYWPWMPIYISHPIKGRKLYDPLLLMWPPKIPFR